MHTVDLLEQALVAAERAGFRHRQDWLGGEGGGVCEVRGQKWIFLDLGQTPAEQLDAVLEALRQEPRALGLPLSPELRDLIAPRKSA
jgi:hypothetical protein